MTVRCGLPAATARRRVRLGRALRHLPVTEQAWVAGDIGEAHVAALAKTRTPVTEQAMARDEAMLVGQAKRLRFDSFGRVLDYWAQHADPDGTEDCADNQLKRIDDELFDADWAEARSRLGDGALVGDLSRTPAQRRADALVEMARRAGTADPDGRRPEPLFTVLVGYETMAGRIPLPGHRRRSGETTVLRGHPPGGAGPGPGVLPRVLRRAGRRRL